MTADRNTSGLPVTHGIQQVHFRPLSVNLDQARQRDASGYEELVESKAVH